LIGLLSQYLKSRKKALYIFYFLNVIFGVLFFMQNSNGTDTTMYWLVAGLGFSTGYWAIFVTMAAEQFGTNLRATAAVTATNMVRGALPLTLALFKWLRVSNGYIKGGWLTGIVIMVITIIAAIMIEETFGKDLNYVEV